MLNHRRSGGADQDRGFPTGRSLSSKRCATAREPLRSGARVIEVEVPDPEVDRNYLLEELE